MRLFLVLFFLESFFSTCLGTIIDKELLALIWLLINTLYIIGWIYKKSDNKTIFIILLIGFLLRLGVLIIDRNVLTFPFNNVDANKFHNFGIRVAEALPQQLLKNYLGFYGQFIGIIYYIFGPYRFFAHFLNISLVMFSATKVIDILDMLKVNSDLKKIIILIQMFMPIPFLLGYALLRESTIYYFIVLSTYSYLKWFENYKIKYVFLTIVTIYIASKYHEGVLALMLPYIYIFLFYNKKQKKVKFGIVNIICLIMMSILGYTIIEHNQSEFLYTANLETGGGSAYLTGVQIENSIDFILFAPIKAVYLILSPMIWKIRGGVDLATFMLDSVVYIIILSAIYRNFRKLEFKFKGLILAFIAASIVFGMGTLNSGTAIRHRNKFLVLPLITYAIVKNNEKGGNDDKNKCYYSSL